MNHNQSFNGKSLKDQEITNLQVTHNNNYSFIQNLLPRDFFGCMLLIFIIATMAPFFNYQLKAAGILIGGCFTLFFLKEKKWLQPEFIIYFYWLVWSFTGYAVCLNEQAFFKTFLRVFQIWIMGFTIAGITAHRGKLEVNFLGIVIGGFILFIISTKSGELLAGMNAQEGVRVSGTADNSNLYGFILLITVAALLYFWEKIASWKNRTIIILLISILAGGIIFSGSRKAFVGLGILIITWLFFCYRKELLKKPYYFIAFIFVFISLYFVSNFMMSNTYMGKRFETELVEGGEERRVTLYKESFDIIINNPIFGIGLGNFGSYASGSSSHSDYMEVALCTGIFGFLLYFAIYVLLWRRLCKIQKQIDDQSILYIIGLFKAIIITVLALGFGRPNFLSQAAWLVLASAIGYTWSLERKLLAQFNSKFGKGDIIASHNRLDGKSDGVSST